MALRYLSREWLDEARRRVEASADFAAAARGLSAAILSVVTEAPEGSTIYLYYRFEDGKLKELASGTDESLTKKPFDLKASGTYDTFRQVNQGVTSAMAAFFQRKLKLEGNLAKAIIYARPLEAYNRALRDIPTEY